MERYRPKVDFSIRLREDEARREGEVQEGPLVIYNSCQHVKDEETRGLGDKGKKKGRRVEGRIFPAQLIRVQFRDKLVTIIKPAFLK
jgi:hypothetical protein